MKTLTMTLIALFIFYNAQAEGCFPEGITFSSQNQINNFRTTYPGCSEIVGDVTISGTNILNINGLNIITSIGGDLIIQSNPHLTSLSGLENLTSIGGDFYFQGNLLISDLNDLNNLGFIGGDVMISANPALTTLSGLQKITSVYGMLWIEENFSLQNLEGLDNVTSITGLVRITSNHSLCSLDGLGSLQEIHGSLMIGGEEHLGGMGNPSLANVSALTQLSVIAGSLTVEYNDNLSSLTGLDNIMPGSINGLYIYHNPGLSECEVASICGYIANPTGDLFISSNFSGCNSVGEVSAACLLISVSEAPKSMEINMGPVPVKDFLTVATDRIEGIKEISILNMHGQLVKKLFFSQKFCEVDFNGIPSGMYMISVSTEKGITISKIVRE